MKVKISSDFVPRKPSAMKIRWSPRLSLRFFQKMTFCSLGRRVGQESNHAVVD